MNDERQRLLNVSDLNYLAVMNTLYEQCTYRPTTLVPSDGLTKKQVE